jgi:hypothetical protein
MAATEEGRGSVGQKSRVNRWLDSDLVGIPATLYTFGVLAVSLAVFRFGGPLAGIIVAVALWIPMVLFAIRGLGKPPAPLDLEPAAEGTRHRVLVIANQGLEDPALCGEICRRADRAKTDAMVIAPVSSRSRTGLFADDVDAELGRAQERVEAAVKALREEGVAASGHAAIADPMESLLDGLREYPPNEVVLLPGRESGWQDADTLAEQVRAEVGLPVTTVGAA